MKNKIVDSAKWREDANMQSTADGQNAFGRCFPVAKFTHVISNFYVFVYST